MICYQHYQPFFLTTICNLPYMIMKMECHVFSQWMATGVTGEHGGLVTSRVGQAPCHVPVAATTRPLLTMDCPVLVLGQTALAAVCQLLHVSFTFDLTWSGLVSFFLIWFDLIWFDLIWFGFMGRSGVGWGGWCLEWWGVSWVELSWVELSWDELSSAELSSAELKSIKKSNWTIWFWKIFRMAGPDSLGLRQAKR